MTAGIEYAKAVFALAEESGTLDSTLGELELVRELFRENPEYINILDTPAISKSEKLELLTEAFGSLSETVENLLKLLCELRSVRLFEAITREYSELYDEAAGIVRVEAVSALALTGAEISAIEKKLSSLGKRIVVKNTVEPEILGGLKLRYEGVQLDGSLKTRLDKLSESIKNVIV